MSAIGKEYGNHGVDTQQVEREWRQVFIVSHTGASKGVMRFPILPCADSTDVPVARFGYAGSFAV